MNYLIAAALLGVALMTASALFHRGTQREAVDALLGLVPFPLQETEEDVGVVAARATDLASQVIAKVDRDRSLTRALQRATIPLRAGEFVVVVGAFGFTLGAIIVALTGNHLIAVLGPVLATAGAWRLVKMRISRRRKAFEAQLPDSLTLIASSLAAGHTFLRAIQMMCEESGPPLSEEFARVVAETRLGDSVVDALQRMSDRLEVRDMDIVVQAIRIQQTVGGRLAELLHTLADFLRARDELRREVRVLTAEGRMSAWVLAGLVPFLFIVMYTLNPDYMQPLFHGMGLAVIGYCILSVGGGVALILKMVKLDV